MVKIVCEKEREIEFESGLLEIFLFFKNKIFENWFIEYFF